MAITAVTNKPVTAPRRWSGSHLDDAGSPADMSKTLGFAPSRIRVVNYTDRIEFEWFKGMTSGHALKTVAAGTRTAETSGGITVSGNTFSAPILQNKQYYWVAE